MNLQKHILPLIILLVFSSCAYEFPEAENYSHEDFGSVNLDRTVFAGDDFIAGLMDGALYSKGQQNSVASILADQFNKVQEFDFAQPEIGSENGLNLYASTEGELIGKWIYEFSGINETSPRRKLTSGEQVSGFSGDKNALNNLSVPALRMGQTNNPELTQNPFFNRISSQPANTYLTEINRRNPTFVILWLGMNDILDYAVYGATGNDNYNDDEIINNRNLTSVEKFSSNFNAIADALLQEPDCKIVVGNFLSLKSLPYFFLRPYDALFLDDSQLATARARYSKFNEAVAIYNRTVPGELARPYIDFYDNGFNPHPQPLVVTDNSLPDAWYPDGSRLEKFRHLNKNEILLFSVSDDMLQLGHGSTIPLDEANYLSESEIEKIENRLTDFNGVIFERAKAQPSSILIANIDSVVRPIAATGKTDAWGEPFTNEIFYFNGVPLEGALGMNSLFSLDALHFNQRGNAFIANIFIDAINQGFGANFPKADINKYIGNVYNFAD